MEGGYKQEIAAFGARPRRIRESKGLSQLDIEIESGIARTEISRIVNGFKIIEFLTLVRLAAALNVELHELFTD